MVVLLVAGPGTVARLTDDRPRSVAVPRLRRLGEPAAFPPDPRRSRARLGITVRDRALFIKLLFPGSPDLDRRRAGHPVPQPVRAAEVRAGPGLAERGVRGDALGTVAAILFQPRLARRFGQITSVVIVQGASIPFLVVLGFSPILWTVILAMAVRNSLMNAGNPIFNAFSMEQVSPVERATLSAAMSVLWQIGWIIGGTWYAVLQADARLRRRLQRQLRHDHHPVHVATVLYWVWFRDTDRRTLEARAAT